VAGIRLDGVKKTFGEHLILRGIDLTVDDGALVVLVGPSGCGKSTLLRTIAGLETADEGSIHIGDRDVTRAAPRDRDVAMVFQSYALYPHLTVRDNLAFGLTLRKTPKDTISSRIKEVSAMLGLGALLERYPRQLSGGQRQRVAMGRAIVRRPAVFLFDEPLSNLDAALRAEVRVEIKRLHHELGTTMIYVTHDQVEAMTLADELVVLNGGAIEQNGPPLEIYETPRTKFVAGFLGSPTMNFLPLEKSDGALVGEGAKLPLAAGRELEGDRVIAGIRPHDVRFESGPASITLSVEVLERMGFEAYVHGRVGGAPFVARAESEVAEKLEVGEEIELTVSADRVHLFDPDTGRAIA
jgi:sn-glycerol 3-phosphate transport system ATP-binding protein/multiple sugar transport system ATP-binding protein